MYKTFTFFSLFILFAVSLFSQRTNKFRTITYDKYHIDSISELRNVDTWLALEMLDSLYRRCEENGFEECSLSKLESYRSEFYLSVSDHTNALKSSFIALRAKSKYPQSDLTWKLKSLRTISHEYIKTQNWFFAAKYLHELEDMAQNTEEEYYYKSETMLLRSLMLMMQGAPDEALVLIDSIPDIMRKDVSAQAQERSVIIKCRSLQYKGSINGFNQRYKESQKYYLQLVDLLNSPEGKQINQKTAEDFLVYSYIYLSNLGTYIDEYDQSAKYYEMAKEHCANMQFFDRSTRGLADYLYNSGRYNELDSLLVPVLNSDITGNVILHEMDHLLKLQIRSLYKRGMFTEATPWVYRFMDATRELFMEKGKYGMDEFMYAYEAEVQKVKMLEQKQRLYNIKSLNWALIISLILFSMIIAVIFYHYKRKQRDNRFLFERVQEINSAYDKLSQLIAVHKDAEKETTNQHFKEKDTYNIIRKYLSENDRFLIKNLSIEIVQEKCEISASTINRHLNDLLGMTFYEYLTYMRLEHACKLLNSTDMIIDAVSDMSGFSSVRTFQRQFKEKYNLSPSQYRKLKRS